MCELLEVSLTNCSAKMNEDQASSKYALEVVKGKLLNSLDAFERGANLGINILEHGERHMKRTLNLSALADGPRMRLLWASFQHLEEEARIVSVALYCNAYFAVFLPPKIFPFSNFILNKKISSLYIGIVPNWNK